MKTTRFGIGTTIIAGLAMISATTTGCAGDPSAPTENNLQAGIEAYYERARPCFYVAGVYPNSTRQSDLHPNFLIDMGFATEAVTVEGPNGRPFQQWDLTREGRAAIDSIIEPKPYERGNRPGERGYRVGDEWGRTTFCYADGYVVRGIVDSQPPTPDLFGLLSWVTYEYEVTGAADWAETARKTVQKYADARISPFFSNLERVLRDLHALNEPQTHRVHMTQTEYGWVDPRVQNLD